jgi:AraC-like DNA-binding protein
MASSRTTTWCFSTSGLSSRERAGALRGLRDRGILPLEPLPGCLPHAEILKWGLPGARILVGTLGGLRQIGDADDPNVGDEVFVGVNLVGKSAVRYHGREVLLDGGEAILFSSIERGFAVHRPTPVSFLGVRLPRKMLAPLAANLDDAVVRVIPGQTSALRLLASYVRFLEPAEFSDNPEFGRAVSTHIYDLVALTIGGHPDEMAFAQGRGARAARLQAIKADVSRNAGDIELTIAAVAARHRVTPRYIHKLFETEDVTFSEFVLVRRLVVAHRLLTDRRLAYRSIASIAFDAGFADLSYFNRAFRRRYRATQARSEQRPIEWPPLAQPTQSGRPVSTVGVNNPMRAPGQIRRAPDARRCDSAPIDRDGAQGVRLADGKRGRRGGLGTVAFAGRRAEDRPFLAIKDRCAAASW